VGYFLGLWGPFVPLTDVEAIGFEMENPVGTPTLEVRAIRLERKSPGDAVLDGLPLVDELGQSVHDSWPGKAEAAAVPPEDQAACDASATPLTSLRSRDDACGSVRGARAR